MSTVHRFEKTNIKYNGKDVLATVNQEPNGCVLHFFQDKKPLENEYKETKKQFSVFIPKNIRDVLYMLSTRKGNIVPHHKNPKQLYLKWERVMEETNITLNKKPLKASYFTRKKRDEVGKYFQTIFHFFYTEDSKIVTHNVRGQEKPFTVCFKTENQEEATDKANCEWLLQEGQIVPHEKHKGSLFLRLGKAPVKTSFTIDVDGKNRPVYARFRVIEENRDGISLRVMKIRFFADDKPIIHHNSKGKRVPFVYSYMTNNPEHVTSEAIKQWLETTSGEIVPHKKVEGKLFLLFEK